MRTKKYFNTVLIAVALSFSVGLVQGQEQPSRRNRADQFYKEMQYAKAALAYEKLVDVKKPSISNMERLAHSYFYIKQYDLAENWYARLVAQKSVSPELRLNYAEVLKQQGKYAEAKLQYEQLLASEGKSETILTAIHGADSAQVWMRNPTRHDIRNEKGVNTSLAEFGVIKTNSGVMYAAEPNSLLQAKSGMTGQAYLRIYAAERKADGSLEYPNQVASSINGSTYHVGPIATNAAEDVLYVTRTFAGKDGERFKADGAKWNKHNLELKIFRKKGAEWVEEDFAYNNVKEYSLGHAFLSPDEQTLYYASDMPGGKGGVDIWYSELQADGSWGVPQNAGDVINTAGDEMFPTLAGKEIYFSSTGHVGMGGLDIFKAKGEKAKYEGVKNLGYPINSASDDFAYVEYGETVDNKVGYLSSNRKGGVGSDDIYSFVFQKPKIRIVLEGVTRDRKTGELLPASTVTLFGAAGDIVSKGQTDKAAQISFEVAPNTVFRLWGEKKGYHADSVLVSAVMPTKDTVIRYTMNLTPVMKVGDKFILENIHYDFDKHNIRPDAAKILDRLVATMRDNPTLKIELSSHTDSRGSDSYNEKLSQRRAQSAVDYLVTRGIARERLVAKGYGEKRLLNRCSNGVDCTKAEHQANRRTEVEVLEL